MEKILAGFLSLIFVLGMASLSQPMARVALCFPSREIPPIVSTNWLNNNLGLADLVVIDIRSPDSYSAGHIPGAINVPSYMWYANPPFGEDVPWMEMPPQNYLFELIGDAGITNASKVVVVGSTSGPLFPVPFALYSTATVTRIAMTLLYAGVKNVAILDGGYEKWVADGYPIETAPNLPTPTTYSGVIKSGIIVSKEYVADKIGSATIIDSRDLEVYLGFIQEPWTARLGHIPTAKSFPTPWLWSINKNETSGEAVYITYHDVSLLEILAEYIVGANKSKEIIIYCGVGGYASTMYFILSEVLGYEDVKVYDGSAQEWTGDMELPVVYEGLGSEYLALSRDYANLQNRYGALQSNYNGLRSSYNKLRDDYNGLLNEYNRLKSDYDELLSRYNALIGTTTPAYLTYVFAATTIIFLLTSVYLGVKARKAGK